MLLSACTIARRASNTKIRSGPTLFARQLETTSVLAADCSLYDDCYKRPARPRYRKQIGCSHPVTRGRNGNGGTRVYLGVHLRLVSKAARDSIGESASSTSVTGVGGSRSSRECAALRTRVSGSSSNYEGTTRDAGSSDPLSVAATSETSSATTTPVASSSTSTTSASSGLDSVPWRDVAILTGSQMVVNLGFSQMVPVLPMFAAQMGSHLGATGVGLIIAAPSVANLLLNVPLGRICDTAGRLPLMHWGTALTATGTILTGVSGSLLAVLPCRFLVGVGSCASMTGAGAYLADLTDRAPQHRAKLMGINSALSGSVWVVGPAVGGWLAETYGYQMSFFIAGSCTALCSLGYRFLPETLKIDATARDANAAASWRQDGSDQAGLLANLRRHVQMWRDDVRPLLHSGHQQALVALSLVPSLRWSCFSTVVVLHASSVIGLGPKEIGFMYTAHALSQAIAMPFGSWIADKVDGSKVVIVVPVGLASCLSFASFGFATDLNHFIAAMATQGLCNGFILPAQGAFRAEVTPPTKRGQAMSFERQAVSTVALIGPISLGFMADLTSCPTTIWFASGLMAVCHLAYVVRAHSGI